MDVLAINTRENTLLFFQYMSSEEEQLKYKSAVPFVHIPYELMAQWSSKSSLFDQDWFKQIWTSEEFTILTEFDVIFLKTQKTLGKLVPDVPEILSNQSWKSAMDAARDALNALLAK